MSVIVHRLVREPVLFLGVATAVLTGLAAEGIISGPLAVIAVVVVTALQREFVTPNAKVSRRKA